MRRPATDKKNGPLWSWALIGLLGAALGWGAAAQTCIKAGGYPFGPWPEDWRYADTNLPMIGSADGFFFMSQANLALDRGYAGLPSFSKLTAAISQISARPVEAVAFYLSLIFHLGLGLLAVAWGRLLKMDRFSAFLACVLIALMPAWLERAGPGCFDTDLPILLFWQAGLYFLARVTAVENDRLAWLNLIPALISFSLLSWIWTSGLGLALGSLAIWAFLFLPRAVWSLKARLAVGVVLTAWLASLVLLPQGQAPAPVVILEIIHSRMALAFGAKTELFYSSIKELYPLSFWKLLEKIGGGVPGGVLALAAGLWGAKKLPALRLPLLVGFICLGAGLKSNRLVYLGVYPLALTAGFLPNLLRDWALGRAKSSAGSRLSWAAGLALSLGLMFSCFYWGAFKRDLDMRWERAHDRLLEALRNDLEGGDATRAYLWNWWDDGYFLAARTELKPLFDGGSQTHTLAYIAARPFLMDDRRTAARWMRFFAIRGEAGLAPLIQVWGPEEAWTKLEELLSADTPAEAAQEAAQLPGGVSWLFPEGKVYWYMPSYFFRLSSWWVPLGLSREPDRALIRPHLAPIGRDEFRYDAESQSLTISQELWDRGYKNFGRVFRTDDSPLIPPWPTGGAPYIVYSEKNSHAYITDQLGIRTLPLYMMAPGGPELLNFRPLAVDSDWGGVWEVL